MKARIDPIVIYRDLRLKQAHTRRPMCIVSSAACIARSRAAGSVGRSADSGIRSMKSILISWIPAGTNKRWSVLRVWKRRKSSRTVYPGTNRDDGLILRKLDPLTSDCCLIIYLLIEINFLLLISELMILSVSKSPARLSRHSRLLKMTKNIREHVVDWDPFCKCWDSRGKQEINLHLTNSNSSISFFKQTIQ